MGGESEGGNMEKKRKFGGKVKETYGREEKVRRKGKVWKVGEGKNIMERRRRKM